MTPPAPGRTPAAPLQDDTGSGTVWVIALCLVIWFATLAAIVVTGVRVGHHRAASAADLAALAAARHAHQGHGPSCAAADSVAGANGARVAACALDGLVVDVHVEFPLPLFSTHATAHARAGPVISSTTPEVPSPPKGDP
ncbi:Rv3654c family TadE-like protein [Marinactinospora thermotolerans]|uniref:Helicase/secretion neighborhood TadE-like protein n=1 Tax=Marinactinospora thermotolerans DSM 45154 TaxID=1122192 RepID=A0A1T4T2U7_9ACTN|nr:Rv3654c family TadE-like protein [Marinactinospora thermotolerans]SKA34581.1 helicase/secretion neighborhood TadE-like protein [Marinactinospora thermotolerans DSM 45154]